MATTSSNSHKHTVSGKSTTSIGHQHTFTETARPADGLTAAEVSALRALLAPVVTPPPPDPVPVPPPVVNPPTGNLQQIIDGTLSGGSVDLTGWTGTGTAIARKPITIKSGLQNGMLVVHSSGVILDGFSVRGPQGTAYNGLECGITTRDAPGPISGLVIRNGTFSRFGYGGMYLRNVVNPLIEYVTVEDAVYAGIMLLSAKGGMVRRAIVKRIGVVGSAANSGNAYGIAASNQSPAEAISTDVLIEECDVEDVPTWHAYDTHGGRNIRFIRNKARRSRHGIFITGGSGVGGTGRSVDVITDGNVIDAPPPGTSEYAIVYVYSTGGTVTRNLARGWPSGHGLLTTSSGDSNATAVGLTVAGDNVWA